MANQPVTREKLINADKDVQVIEDFIKKSKDETVITRFGDQIMTLKGLEEEVKKSGGYFKRYTTLAAANADIANIPVNSVVKVTDAVDGGDYEKAAAGATTLTKSPHDPALQAKTYVDSNALFKPKSIITLDTTAVDLNSVEYQNGYFLFTLTPKHQVHLNFPYYGDSAGSRGAGALIAVKEPSGTFARQLFITPDNIYFRATVSDVFENWIKLTSEKDVENLRSEINKNVDLIYDRIGLSFNPKTFVEYLPTNFTVIDGKAKYQVISPAPGSRSVIVKIEPDTTYTVVKTASERFRLATFPVLPQEAALGTVIKGVSDEHTNDAELVYFTFTSPIDAQYLVFYVSVIDEAPTSEIYEGTYTGATFNKTVFSRDLEASNIILGKNLFNHASYLDDGIVLQGPVGASGPIIESSTLLHAKTAVLKIKPDTAYTVSKSQSDRFRIGLCNVKPTLGTANIEIIAGESNDNSSQVTFTSKNTTNYLVLYLAANTAAPSEVQVEEGEAATEYESFGYKFFPEAKSKGSSSGSAAYDYAGAGDAIYISKAEATAGAWKDSQYTIPATDDTDTLQALFDSAKGVVSLEPNKKYKVTRPIRYNPERVKLVKGNMAHIVCIGDIETFQMVGTLSSSASASGMNRSLAYNEMGPLVVALKITNPMEVLGTAFVVNKVMSPNFLACNFAYLRRGIAFRGINRNAILSSNHIYACSDYGIHFEQGGNLHQVNIIGNHISYCRKNIFSENHHIYNIQITGSDIETSSYPTLEIGGAAECDMHFLQTTAILEDLEIVGNTVEDHWNTTKMIRLEGDSTSTDKISCVTISGNVTGNSSGSVIEIGGASGVEILGQFKANAGYVVDVIGNLDGFKLSTQSKQGGGGLFRAVGDYSLKDVTVCGNNLSNSVTQNPILVDVTSLDNCNFSDNDLRVTGTGGFHATHKAPITIHADTMKLVRADNNTIANTSSSTKAVEIVARDSSEKGSMRGNMANFGTFTAPTTFAVDGNI